MAKEVLERLIAVAVDGQLYPENEKGPARVGVRCRVVEGPETGREEIVYMGLGEGQQAEITIKQLRVMGWSDNDITSLAGLGSTKFDLVKSQSTKGDKTYVNWNAYERRQKVTMRDEDRAAFAAQFSSLAAQVKPVVVTELNAAPEELPAARAAGEITKKPDGLPF